MSSHSDDLAANGFHYFFRNLRILALDLAELEKLEFEQSASELKWETVESVSYLLEDAATRPLSVPHIKALGRLRAALDTVPSSGLEAGRLRFPQRAFMRAMKHAAWVDVRREAKQTLHVFADQVAANEDYFNSRSD